MKYNGGHQCSDPLAGLVWSESKSLRLVHAVTFCHHPSSWVQDEDLWQVTTSQLHTPWPLGLSQLFQLPQGHPCPGPRTSSLGVAQVPQGLLPSSNCAPGS